MNFSNFGFGFGHLGVAYGGLWRSMEACGGLWRSVGGLWRPMGGLWGPVGDLWKFGGGYIQGKTLLRSLEPLIGLPQGRTGQTLQS